MAKEISVYEESSRQDAIQGDLFVPDQLFASDNDLEIPALLLEMQAKECQIPFLLWGEQRRTLDMQGQGVLHFYCDDYRYGDKLYQHPENILKHNPAIIVEPNYSLFNETPIAFGMQAIYKKRLVARAMQSKGIRVMVDLNVASKFYWLNMLGVPKGWSAFCTRGYSDRINYLATELEIAKLWADGNPLLFVVYGGGLEVKKFCKDNGLIYIHPTLKIKKREKAIESIRQSIAFFGQQIKAEDMLPVLPTTDSVIKKQIEYN